MKKVEFIVKSYDLTPATEHIEVKEVKFKGFNLEFEGHEFFCIPEELRFVHKKSMKWFSVPHFKKINSKNMMDAFNFKLEQIGRDRFIDVINNQPNFDDEIKKLNRQLELGRVISKEFGRPIFDVRMMILGKLSLDIIELDDFLKRLFGEKYPDNMSMKDFLQTILPEDKMKIFNELMMS